MRRFIICCIILFGETLELQNIITYVHNAKDDFNDFVWMDIVLIALSCVRTQSCCIYSHWIIYGILKTSLKCLCIGYVLQYQIKSINRIFRAMPYHIYIDELPDLDCYFGNSNHRITLQWRHIKSDGVSNLQPHDCLLRRLFKRRSKRASKLRVTGFCKGNSPVTSEFPAQKPVTPKMFPFDDIIMKYLKKKIQNEKYMNHPNRKKL